MSARVPVVGNCVDGRWFVRYTYSIKDDANLGILGFLGSNAPNESFPLSALRNRRQILLNTQKLNVDAPKKV